MKLGIVGLGLMGGSFALDFKSIYPKSKIYGLDISNKNQNRAIDLGLVDELIEFDDVFNKHLARVLCFCMIRNAQNTIDSILVSPVPIIPVGAERPN